MKALQNFLVRTQAFVVKEQSRQLEFFQKRLVRSKGLINYNSKTNIIMVSNSTMATMDQTVHLPLRNG
jgi:hypothetical protein